MMVLQGQTLYIIRLVIWEINTTYLIKTLFTFSKNQTMCIWSVQWIMISNRIIEKIISMEK